MYPEGVLPYITCTGICAAQRGRDFEAPDLERGIHFRGVFYNGVLKNCGSWLYLLLKIVADYEEASI